MRILAATDSQDYGMAALEQAARIGANAWAHLDVLLLADRDQGKAQDALASAVNVLEQVLGGFGPQGPYGEISPQMAKRPSGPGTPAVEFRGRRSLRLWLETAGRPGVMEEKILRRAEGLEADLLVLGCDMQGGCPWRHAPALPRRVARKAPCSVLIVKGQGVRGTITSFFDRSPVTQESLELLNQMVTINGADLRIAGLLTDEEGIGEDQRRILELVSYFSQRQIRAWTSFVSRKEVADFVQEATMKGMVALWIGASSFLARIFLKDLLEEIVEHARSSILVLR